MTTRLSETSIVKALAEYAIRRITRKVIADLRRMNHTLSGEDSVLQTTWDEICAQMQYDQWPHWDAYDETVQALVGGYVEDLPQHEKEAIWLQSDPGFDWGHEDHETRESDPVVVDDIVSYITNEYIYSEAGRWSNRRIQAYIERASMSD